MANKVITDSFETLAENVGLKPQADQGTAEQGGQQQQQAQAAQIKKMDEVGKKKAVVRYRQLQEEIKQLQVKRSQDVVKYRKPGFTDEEKQQKEIKQLEEKPSFVPPAGGTTAGEKELPPLPARRAQRKTEMLRGVSG